MSKSIEGDYITRKIQHWTRFGTPAQINPQTGAACPKWKIEADEERARKLANKRRD
jgi:hypothetical protein